MTPRVSIVIPTFNRAAMLLEAVRSCLSQSIDEIQVIVADDGSTDDTAARLRGLSSRIELLELPHSGLPAVARNRALARCRGELVAFLDSDDVFLPDKLSIQTAALAAHSEAALVYSNGIFFEGTPDHATGQVLDGMPRPQGDCLPDLLRGNFLFPSTVLTRRARVEEVGGFDEDPGLRGAEDFDLWLRLAVSHPMVFAPGVVAAIRRHPGCLSIDTATIRSAAIRSLTNLQESHRRRLASLGPEIHEGLARHYAAVAKARYQQGKLDVASAFAAAGHSLRAPLRTASAWLAWRKSREARRAAQPKSDTDRTRPQ